MKDLLSKLTIVIPTYERHSFINRAMNFWDGKGPKVYILDGSNLPFPQDILAQYSNKINYFHLPISLADRLKFFCDEIMAEEITNHNEYIALQGDDEFYIPSGLEKCIEQLELDNDLETCCGIPLGFRPIKGFGIEGFKCYEKLLGYQRNETDGLLRSVAHMGDFVQAHIYSIVRKSSWIQSTRAFCKNEIPVYAMFEIQFEMSASFAGKSKVLPCLTWLRSYDENPSTPNTKTDTSFDIDGYHFDDWWESKNFSEQRVQFVDQTSNAFMILASISKEKAENAVRCSSEAYVNFLKLRKASPQVLLSKFVPLPIKLLVRKLRYWLKQFNRTEILEMAENIANSNIEVDLKELAEIRNLLLRFHRIKHEHQR